MVKIISLTCAFLVLFIGHVFAISVVNIEVVKEAQDYGKNNAQSHLQDFLLPWISYEEKAVTLNETAEHAYLYTSFLLIATDARDKSVQGQGISLLDGEKVMTDYADSLTFSVVLFGDKPDFAQNMSAVLKQDKKAIRAYQMNVPQNAEMISKDSKQPLYKAQCYFYFFEKDIISDIPVTLSLTTSDRKHHHFYFDMEKIK